MDTILFDGDIGKRVMEDLERDLDKNKINAVHEIRIPDILTVPIHHYPLAHYDCEAKVEPRIFRID